MWPHSGWSSLQLSSSTVTVRPIAHAIARMWWGHIRSRKCTTATKLSYIAAVANRKYTLVRIQRKWNLFVIFWGKPRGIKEISYAKIARCRPLGKPPPPMLFFSAYPVSSIFTNIHHLSLDLSALPVMHMQCCFSQLKPIPKSVLVKHITPITKDWHCAS